MFKFLILAAILGFAAAAESEVTAETKSLENEISPEGVFNYAFLTSNGIDIASHGDANTMSGSYKYLSPDGTAIELTYTADENGYHPQGAHLPTPPPIPEYVMRAIQWNEAHPVSDKL